MCDVGQEGHLEVHSKIPHLLRRIHRDAAWVKRVHWVTGEVPLGRVNRGVCVMKVGNGVRKWLVVCKRCYLGWRGR